MAQRVFENPACGFRFLNRWERVPVDYGNKYGGVKVERVSVILYKGKPTSAKIYTSRGRRKKCERIDLREMTNDQPRSMEQWTLDGMLGRLPRGGVFGNLRL